MNRLILNMYCCMEEGDGSVICTAYTNAFSLKPVLNALAFKGETDGTPNTGNPAISLKDYVFRVVY